SSTRPWAKATAPRLSLTEMRSRGIVLPGSGTGFNDDRMSGPRGGQHNRRQQPVLLFQYPRREQLGCVSGEDRHSRLDQNHSSIVLLFHQVHGAAALDGTALQDGFVYA